MAEIVGKYQLVYGNGVSKMLGEETEGRAKKYARDAVGTDPDVMLLEITEQGAIVVNFRE